MAIRELNNNGGVYTYEIASPAPAGLRAGAVIAVDANGRAVAADRATATKRASVAGLLADDVQRDGSNTWIQNDPVGSTYVDPVTKQLVSNVNGYFVGIRRQALDYNQAEQINTPTNLNEGAFTFAKRGVAVYQAPGQFVTDQYVLATAAASADTSGLGTFAKGDLLVQGYGANAGKLVKWAAASNADPVGRVEEFKSGLLTVSLV